MESFYYLFKQLEKFEKLPILGEDEEKNQETIDDYTKRHEGIPSLTSPLAVNGALAVELALKFLIFKEMGSYECIHNLQRLFEQLVKSMILRFNVALAIPLLHHF